MTKKNKKTQPTETVFKDLLPTVCRFYKRTKTCQVAALFSRGLGWRSLNEKRKTVSKKFQKKKF